MKKSKKKQNTLGNPLVAAEAAKGIPPFVWVAALGVVGFVLYKGYQGWNSTLESIGLKDSKDERDAKNFTKTVAYQTAFDPNYHATVNATTQLSDYDADNFATMLYEAHGYINDDENAIYGVFNQLRSKAEVSKVADIFFNKYQEDLYQFLNGFLDNDTELIHIVNRVKQMKDR